MAASSPRLQKVTPATFRDAIALKVQPAQEHLVEPVVVSLAEAYVYGDRAWPRLICDGDRIVGFLMAFFAFDFAGDVTRADGTKGDGAVPDVRSGLWRLTIAADEQGRGYGRFGVDAVAAEIRRRGGDRLTVTWHPGDDGPEPFYLRLGFRATGETAGDERVGVLDLA